MGGHGTTPFDPDVSGGPKSLVFFLFEFFIFLFLNFLFFVLFFYTEQTGFNLVLESFLDCILQKTIDVSLPPGLVSVSQLKFVLVWLFRINKDLTQLVSHARGL